MSYSYVMDYPFTKRNELLMHCYNRDEHWKHVKQRKPVTKEHLLYDSTYMKCKIGKSVVLKKVV